MNHELKRKDILKNLNQLEEKISFYFDDKDLLITAFSHPSFAHPKGQESYERLEFLGDAVLNLIITEFLFAKYQGESEGMLAKIKSTLLSTENLSNIARKLELEKYLMVGPALKHLPPAALADVFEAFVAAMYIDKGLDQIKGKVIELLFKDISSIEEILSEYTDYKTLLQELSHKYFKKTPIYRTVEAKGPDHNKEFKVWVMINGVVIGCGKGKRKQEAQKQAAKMALERFDSVFCFGKRKV